jgi:hypothetical protein
MYTGYHQQPLFNLKGQGSMTIVRGLKLSIDVNVLDEATFAITVRTTHYLCGLACLHFSA